MPQGPIAVKDFAPGETAGSFLNFAANTAGTQIKTGTGVLLGVNVNTVGTGGANTLTLYDGTSTSGPVMGAFSTTTLGAADYAPMAFVTGLFAVLTGTTTSGNITVVYQ